MHRPMPTSGKAKSTKSTILSAEETLAPSSPAAGAVLVGYHQDPLAHLADLIIQRHIGALPDLTHCIVLLPDTLAAPRLRRHLLAAAALGDEARLVHTLWQAWHRQLRDAGERDPETAYLAALRSALDRDDRCIFFMAGYSELAPPERAWAQRLAEQGRLTILIQPGATDQGVVDIDGAPHPADVIRALLAGWPAPAIASAPPTPYAQFLDTVFAPRTLAGDVSEEQLFAVRARRFAAQHPVSPATPHLELLRTAGAEDQARDRGELLAAVHRFEQDIVLHENVGRNLRRYREHLAYRRARLPQAIGNVVQELLDAVEHAATPLLLFLNTSQRHAPARMLTAFETSLRALGMEEAFARDAAGQRVLQELALMRAALAGRQLPMTWRDFRTWLGRTLERFNFQAPAPAAAVQLMNLTQSTLLHCEALILAGANAEHLPSSGESTPFFNDAVRRDLGLPTARARYAQRSYAFRRLLDCAPEIVITLQHEQNGEARLPSPWVEAISRFHGLAYGNDLAGADLAALINRPEAPVLRADTAELPAPQPRPAPSSSAELMPGKISAGAYQELIDCPYQFFAARSLRLSAPETVREALQKSDYGERVHLILQAFHVCAAGYPGPYTAPLTAANREHAIASLADISRAVFAKDLEDNFEHRGWLQRWLNRIPEYIDWQIARQQAWQVDRVEVKSERRLHEHWLLHGRLDRIDRGVDGVALVAAANGARLASLLEQISAGAPLPAWGDERTCGYCVLRGVCRKDAWPMEAESACTTTSRALNATF